MLVSGYEQYFLNGLRIYLMIWTEILYVFCKRGGIIFCSKHINNFYFPIICTCCMLKFPYYRIVFYLSFKDFDCLRPSALLKYCYEVIKIFRFRKIVIIFIRLSFQMLNVCFHYDIIHLRI